MLHLILLPWLNNNLHSTNEQNALCRFPLIPSLEISEVSSTQKQTLAISYYIPHTPKSSPLLCTVNCAEVSSPILPQESIVIRYLDSHPDSPLDCPMSHPHKSHLAAVCICSDFWRGMFPDDSQKHGFSKIKHGTTRELQGREAPNDTKQLYAAKLHYQSGFQTQGEKSHGAQSMVRSYLTIGAQRPISVSIKHRWLMVPRHQSLGPLSGRG